MEISGIDLSELQFSSIGSWPKKIRIGLCVASFVLTFVLGYLLLLSDKMMEIEQAEVKLEQQKNLFKDAQQKVANLQVYKDEVKVVEPELEKLSEQLPPSNEVALILDELTQQAQASGLNFVSIKPVQQESKEFYQDSGIELEMDGTYNGLGDYVSRVANMKRIVTFHDFTIKKDDNSIGISSGKLSITLMAKTYWSASIGGDPKP